MGSTDNQGGADEDQLNPSLQNSDGLSNPDAIVLFQPTAILPDDWQEPWKRAGWTVTVRGSRERIPEATVRTKAKALIALPWPGADDISAAGAIRHGFLEANAALDVPTKDTISSGSASSGGMVRRGDFLANLSVVASTPGSDCWVLIAIRVDQASELVSRLDKTTIFDLEEQIAARFATALNADDAFTIWLELGFGVLVRRDNSEQVFKLAGRICTSVANEPCLIAGEQGSFTVSVGVALPPKTSAEDGADRWFAAAHAAQAIAYRHGGNRYDGVLSREFEPMPADRVLIVREWLQEEKLGDNLMLEFQPILPVAIGATALYSVHAKLRDYRAPLGGVDRCEYLRLAREAGAMVMIDRLSLFGAFEALEQERARGRSTRLLVPVDAETLEGVPWRWLEAELHRRRHLADGLIVELEASQKLHEPNRVERIRKLRELGVRVGLSSISNGLDWVSEWSSLPFDVLRVQYPVMDAVPPDIFHQHLSAWLKIEQSRQLIVDEVEDTSVMARFVGLTVDYMRGKGLATIGPRLDFEFD